MTIATSTLPEPSHTAVGIASKQTTSASASVDFNRLTDEQFLIAAEHMRLESEVQLLLRSPYRELMVQVPVRMDDGRLELFHGYRVQHNAVRGPYKGGIRYHHQVDLNEVRSLAGFMTWKTAVDGNVSTITAHGKASAKTPPTLIEFDCGYRSPTEWMQDLQEAVRLDEIPDPSTKPIHAVAPRIPLQERSTVRTNAHYGG